MRYVKPTETRDDVRMRLERRINLERERGYTLWTAELRDGTIIGDAGLAPLEGTGPLVEVGYHFAEEHWGAGYATESAIASIRYGFKTCGLDRIVAVAHPDNRASMRVMEKSGMTLVGPSTYKGKDVVMYEARQSAWLAWAARG